MMRPSLSWIVLLVFGLGNLVLPSLHHRYAHSGYLHADAGEAGLPHTCACSAHGKPDTDGERSAPAADASIAAAPCLAASGFAAPDSAGSEKPHQCGHDCAVCHALAIGAVAASISARWASDDAPRLLSPAPLRGPHSFGFTEADRPRGPPIAPRV